MSTALTTDERLFTLPDEIMCLKGVDWGRPVRTGDIVLDMPQLIGVRRGRNGVQRLYKTIENPSVGQRGARGFILDDKGKIGLEQALVAIMKWSTYSPWDPI